MEENRNWHLYLDDMVRFIERAILFSNEKTQAEFEADAMRFDATLRNLELIGEAAAQLPELFRAENADIPWRMIIATRNRLAHGYLGIDNDVIWNILKVDLPVLLRQVAALSQQIKGRSV